MLGYRLVVLVEILAQINKPFAVVSALQSIGSIKPLNATKFAAGFSGLLLESNNFILYYPFLTAPRFLVPRDQPHPGSFLEGGRERTLGTRPGGSLFTCFHH